MVSLRNEEKIMASWKGRVDKPLVSICCLTFNHEKYIEDAIKGFLIQETNFSFEIIIHDDASIDGTQKVINRYASHYPNIIRTIIQPVNTFSKQISPGIEFLIPAARGHFIALCEGDDFWIDKYKISKQVQFFFNKPDISMVFSSAIQRSKSRSDFVRNLYTEREVNEMNIEWVLKAGGGFFPTCTCMLRADLFKKVRNWLPMHVAGDYAIAVLARIYGPFGYIEEPTAVYNVHGNSLTHFKEASTYDSLQKELLSYKRNVNFYDELFKEVKLNCKTKMYLYAKALYALTKAFALNRVLVTSIDGVRLTNAMFFKTIYFYIRSQLFRID